MKYFVSNAEKKVPQSKLLLVAFQRWRVERCFEDQNQEVGLDCFEGRRYLRLKRHLIMTMISYLFLSKIRYREREKNPNLTIQQMRDATNAIVMSWYLPDECKDAMLKRVAARIVYHQRRNAVARECHTRTRLARYSAMNINPDNLTQCQWDSR